MNQYKDIEKFLETRDELIKTLKEDYRFEISTQDAEDILRIIEKII